jgi:hypothetical protein
VLAAGDDLEQGACHPLVERHEVDERRAGQSNLLGVGPSIGVVVVSIRPNVDPERRVGVGTARGSRLEAARYEQEPSDYSSQPH